MGPSQHSLFNCYDAIILKRYELAATWNVWSHLWGLGLKTRHVTSLMPCEVQIIQLGQYHIF